MVLRITKNCIKCDICVPECPNNAISMLNDSYQINSQKCTECIGIYPIPNCQKVCPINNAIIKMKSKNNFYP